MTAQIDEGFDSRKFTVARQSVVELTWNLWGSYDDAEIKALLRNTTPASFDGLALDSYNADHQGGGVWKGFRRYAGLEDDDEYTFDTGGGKAKITQSFGTVNSYAPDGLVAPDFRGAIGVGDDSVEGVDIVIPAFAWTETHKID